MRRSIPNSRSYSLTNPKLPLHLARFCGTLNHEAFYHYFSLAFIPGRLTPFTEITELRGGEMLEIDLAAGSFERRRYHQLRYDPDPTLREADLVPELRERGHEVEVIDAYAESLDQADVLRWIARSAPDVVGLTTLTCNGSVVWSIGREFNLRPAPIWGQVKRIRPNNAVKMLRIALRGLI